MQQIKNSYLKGVVQEIVAWVHEQVVKRGKGMYRLGANFKGLSLRLR